MCTSANFSASVAAAGPVMGTASAALEADAQSSAEKLAKGASGSPLVAESEVQFGWAASPQSASEESEVSGGSALDVSIVQRRAAEAEAEPTDSAEARAVPAGGMLNFWLESPQQPPPMPAQRAALGAPVPMQALDTSAVSAGVHDSSGLFDDEDDSVLAEFLMQEQQGEGAAAEPKPARPDRRRPVVRGKVQRSYRDEFTDLIIVLEGGRSVTLSGVWVYTDVEAGDMVHWIGEPGEETPDAFDDLAVSNSANLLVVLPDVLVTSTRLASTFQCARKAVLSDRLKDLGRSSAAMTYGNIIHELFEESMRTFDFSTSSLQSLASQLVAKHTSSLFYARESEASAAEHIAGVLPALQGWAAATMPSARGPAPTQSQSAPAALARGQTSASVITSVVDIEEQIWSPSLGLKGVIDGTVEGEDGELLAFELKTGRQPKGGAPKIEHKAQTMLYTLMLQERHRRDVTAGILTYSAPGDNHRLAAKHVDLSHIMMQRNRVARFIGAPAPATVLPPVVNNPRACKYCFVREQCAVAKVAEDGAATPGDWTGLDASDREALQGHLTEAHMVYFRSWAEMLGFEACRAQKEAAEIWTMGAAERQAVGRCWAGLTLESRTAEGDGSGQFLNRFVRQEPFDVATGKRFRPLTASSGIGRNDTVVLSTLDGDTGVSYATVREVQADAVIVSSRTAFNTMAAGTQWRIDKDSFTTGFTLTRANLFRLFIGGTSGQTRLRELIVDLAPPQFDDAALAASQVMELSPSSMLNPGQRAAVEHAMHVCTTLSCLTCVCRF